MQALSQLSYGPSPFPVAAGEAAGGEHGLKPFFPSEVPETRSVRARDQAKLDLFLADIPGSGSDITALAVVILVDARDQIRDIVIIVVVIVEEIVILVVIVNVEEIVILVVIVILAGGFLFGQFVE